MASQRLARVAVSLLVGAGMLGAAVPAAQARIALGVSIAKVHLDDLRSEVTAVRGAPRSTRNVKYGAAAKDAEEMRYGYHRLAIVVFDGRVVSITTRSEKERTPEGIRVGSSRSVLRGAYPEANCFSKGICEVGSCTGVQPLPCTQFGLRKGRVARVTITYRQP